nr:hypothetical protein [Tanacetum cinerariifolium]
MEMDEISERYIAPCFVNGLKAYDGEVNLEFDENLISNEYAVKLCLDYEKDKVELDGKTVKEQEDPVKRIKGEALKDKDDPDAFIFPISILNTQDRLFSIFDGVYHQTFRAARFDVLRTAESDSDDKEEYTSGTHDEEAGSSRSKRPRQHEIVEEVLLPQVHHEFLLWEGCSLDAKSRYNTRLPQLLPRHIYSPCIIKWDVLNRMGCDGEIDDMLRIRLHEAGSEEDIFTSAASIRAFNINEPIYAELCHEYYFTYEFNEVCAGDELQSKKIIRFRLGDLRSDEHFNAQDYWLSISREEHLGLSRSPTSTIRNPFLRVIHKMITYGLCQRTTGYDKIHKNDLWLLKDVVTSLSALIYCRDVDTTTLRDLIDSDSDKAVVANDGGFEFLTHENLLSKIAKHSARIIAGSVLDFE